MELEVGELAGTLMPFPLIFTRTDVKLRVCNQKLVVFFGCTVMELLFSEELGLILEVSQLDEEAVIQRYRDAGVECHRVGRTCAFGPEALVRYHPKRGS